MDVIRSCLLFAAVVLQSDIIASLNHGNGNTVNITVDFNNMENNATMSFSSGDVTDVLQGSITLLEVNVTCKICTNYTQIQFEIDDDFIAAILEPNTTLTHIDGDLFVASVNVTGKFFGYTTLYLTLVTFGDVVTTQDHPVVVSRERTTLDVAYNVLIMFFIVLANITFGCEFDVGQLKGYFKKPVGVLIGLFCQYGFMPTLAVLSGIVGKLDNATAFGLLAYGCSPGGGGSNVFAVLLGGDINLSLTMTFMSMAFSFVFMPLWLYTVGQRYATEDAKIPFVNIIIFFIVLLVPTAAGLLLRIFRRPWAEKIIKYLRPISMIGIIILGVLNVYLQYYVFILMGRLGLSLILPCVAIPYCGYLLGLVIPLIFRQTWTHAKTIAIETGTQNMSIALVLLRSSLPSPQSEISTTPVIVAGLLAMLPLIMLVFIRKAFIFFRAKFCPKIEEDEKDELKPNEVACPNLTDNETKDNQAHQNNNVDKIKEDQMSNGVQAEARV